MRRVFFFVIIITLIGGGVYFYIQKKNTATNTPIEQGFKEFFPLGTKPSGTSSQETLNQNNNTSSQEQSQKDSIFKQITKRSVAGYTVFSKIKTISIPNENPKIKPKTETVLEHVVRYVSRQSGFVYEIKNDLAPLQISNVFIPNIYEAFFVNNNNTAILRFLQGDQTTVGTYSVPIPEENPDGTRTQKPGTFFPNNILTTTTSPDTKELVQLIPGKTTTTILISDAINGKRKELVTSPLKEWLLSWVQPKTIYAQTKASGTVEGYLYKIDTTEKKMRRVLGNIRGLTTSISPSGLYILYSESTNTGFLTKIFNTKTGSVQVLDIPILPEKCVWLKNEDIICAGGGVVPEGTYPDVWYAGLASFSDQLFHIYTKNNVFDIIYKNTQESFDMTQLQIDESRNLLFFIDKTTGYLWQVSL